MSECLRIVGMLGTLLRGILEKMGSQGWGKKRKACRGDSKEDKKCVCVGFNGKRGRGGVGKETICGDI